MMRRRRPPAATPGRTASPDPVPMRTVFLGTSDFAATVLRALAGSPHRPVLVVTPPDRRRGRGRRMAAPPAAAAAREAGLEVLQTESVNDPSALERLRSATPDVGVVCAFGQLIREPLLSELEMLNVHPSLLPRWRGAAPIERAIMAGDAQTGTTIMRLTEGLDSGPIALQERVTIDAGEDFGSLAPRLAALSGDLMVAALGRRARGDLELLPQDDGLATYAEKISPQDRRLDPARPAIELERTVRALTPHIGAFLELEGGERLGVRRASATDGALVAGTLEPDGDRLRLGCGEGALVLEQVQPASGRPMPIDAYLRGHGAPARAL
jgi:methionyl-tRNA formyltransferase